MLRLGFTHISLSHFLRDRSHSISFRKISRNFPFFLDPTVARCIHTITQASSEQQPKLVTSHADIFFLFFFFSPFAHCVCSTQFCFAFYVVSVKLFRQRSFSYGNFCRECDCHQSAPLVGRKKQNKYMNTHTHIHSLAYCTGGM